MNAEWPDACTEQAKTEGELLSHVLRVYVLRSWSFGSRLFSV